MSGSRPDWLQAKQVLADVLVDLGTDEPDVGWLDRLDEGLHSVAFSAEVCIDGEERPVVVRIPKAEVADDQPMRIRRATEVRRRLIDRDLVPFRVPEPLGTAPAEAGLGVVDTTETGIALEDIEGSVDPVAITAHVAAACHRLDASAFRDLVDGYPTRREHAESALEVFARHDCETFRAARDWCEAHLPEETPASLLHGDLLGQNILVSLPFSRSNSPGPDEVSMAVIDWESTTLGDPAYDLAIVSRGHRKVFKADGQRLPELVDAYNDRAETPVDIDHVRLWELWLKANFFLDVFEDEGMSAHAEQKMANLKAVLRRC